MTSVSDASNSESLLIPYAAAGLPGRRVLVLAAHPDDEVGGPGGTLALLAPDAEAIRTWIATDGTRQEGAGNGDRAGYASRRRQESAEAAAALGLPVPEFGGLPDRELAAAGSALDGAIAGLIADLRPDLVFCPSPVEIHPDHRALAEAVYGRIAASRPEDADHDLYRYLRLAFYEISHPLLPNTLVDVAGAAERKTRALAAFASQQAVRDYASALAGLNAYRRLTLGGTGPVEAFRVVSYEEASTHSLEELRRAIGPSSVFPGERAVAPAAIVVRTRNRPALLAEALDSLAAQRARPRSVVVVNDGGAPAEPVAARFRDAFALACEELPQRVGRSAAANRGLARAGEELVGFLDDDDRLYPDHVERLARAHRGGPEPVVYSDAATVHYRRDGEAWTETRRVLQYSLDFDPDYLLLANYIPIHTLLAPAALLRKAGGFDEKLPYSEDWDLLIRLSAETSFRHVRAVTCEYRVFDEGESDHVAAGGAAFQEARKTIYARYAARRTDDGLARIVDRLRAQLTAWYHRAGAARRDAERLASLERSAAALERERADLRDRLAASREQAAELGDANRAASAHIAALHAEIARLNGIQSQIYASRTWRVHLFLERLRGRG